MLAVAIDITTNNFFDGLKEVLSKSIHVLKGDSSLLSLSVDIDLSDIRWVSELWLVSPTLKQHLPTMGI